MLNITKIPFKEEIDKKNTYGLHIFGISWYS